MNDKQLGKALLSLDTTPKLSDMDPRSLARHIVDRDRRRIRVLAALTTFFWIAATAGIVFLAIKYVMIVEPRLNAYAAGRAQLDSDWKDWAMAVQFGAKGLLLCIVSLFFAALSTVALILFSRHATLRQINASLIELSEQLKPRQPQ
jgi:hypothetical protein